MRGRQRIMNNNLEISFILDIANSHAFRKNKFRRIANKLLCCKQF
jgi:hypothetical protein